MKKLEGLQFLHENFPSLTVDCLFVRNSNELIEDDLYRSNKKEQVFKVRTGRRLGSELNLPYGSFANIEDVKMFIHKNNKQDSNIEFVIHRISSEYFSAPFVGTLAVYNNFILPSIRIEIQKVTKERLEAVDKRGKRARDWEPCLILDYEFLNKVPKVYKRDKYLDINSIKTSLLELHRIGERIFELYDEKEKNIETYTRFNIYNSGKVTLDDHRSNEAFVGNNDYINKSKKIK